MRALSRIRARHHRHESGSGSGFGSGSGDGSGFGFGSDGEKPHRLDEFRVASKQSRDFFQRQVITELLLGKVNTD